MFPVTARDDNLREFSEEIISVLIVSDVNLEPIGKAWGKTVQIVLSLQ